MVIGSFVLCQFLPDNHVKRKLSEDLFSMGKGSTMVVLSKGNDDTPSTIYSTSITITIAAVSTGTRASIEKIIKKTIIIIGFRVSV